MFLSLILGVIVARLLGPEGKGAFALFNTTGMFLVLFSKLGIGQASVYYIGSGEYSKERIAGTIFSAGGIIAILLSAGLVYYLIAFHPQLLGEATPIWVLGLLILAVPAKVTNLFARLIFLANEQIVNYNLNSLVTSTFTLALGAICLVMSSRIEVLVIAHTASVALVAILSVSTLKLKRLTCFCFEPHLFRLLVTYGIQSNIGNIAMSLFLRLDFFIVGTLLGTEAVGLYTVAVGLMEKLLHVPRSMAPVLFQKVSGDTQEESTAFITSLYRKGIVALVPIALLLVVTARPFIQLLYPGFEKSVEVAYLLLPGIFMLGLFEIGSSALLGRGETTAYMVFNLLATLLNVGMCFLLIPDWGINGAALASTIAYTVASLTALIYFANTTGSSWGDFVPSIKDWEDIAKLLQPSLKGILERVNRSVADHDAAR
jgi:O-antigen/teichoic acid export membrane protein